MMNTLKLPRPTLVLIGTCGLLLSGCVAKKPIEPVSAIPTTDQVSAMRSIYTNAFPAARVGVVASVLPDEPYALVNEIETKDVQVGQIVTFLDAAETVIAHGEVVKVDPGQLAVKFAPLIRAPQIGDAAVKF